MNKLRLSVIKKPFNLKAKTLSMDEYLRFVLFNLKYAVGKKAYRRLKKDQSVRIPFCLR